MIAERPWLANLRTRDAALGREARGRRVGAFKAGVYARNKVGYIVALMSVSYFVFFTILGTTLPYLSPVLLEMGYSKQQAGLILGLFALCHAVVPLLGGRLSDRHLSADRTLQWCGMLMLVCAVLLWIFAQPSALFLALLLIFAVVRSPIIPLQDTLAMQVADNNPSGFARMRMLGSLGFAAAVTAFGYLAEAAGLKTLFPVLAGCSAVFLMHALRLPREKKHPETAQIKGFLGRLGRSWWIWLLAMMCHWFCFGPYNYGFTLLLAEQGVPQRLTGWFWSIGVFVEIGLFLGSGWFFDRWNYRNLLFVAFIANLLRWLLIAIYPSPWMIAIAQLLYGPSFAFFYAAAMEGIFHYCGGVQRASFQSLFSTCIGGVAGFFGSTCAGWLHHRMEFRYLILWFLPIQVLAIVLLAINPLAPDRRKGAAQAASSEGFG